MARGYKTGGRQKGTPNKLSSGVKEALEEWIIGEVPNLPKYFSKLTEKEKVDAIPRYLPFVTARINGVDLQIDSAEDKYRVERDKRLAVAKAP